MIAAASGSGVFAAWAALFLGTVLLLAYRRASLFSSSCLLGALDVAYWALGTAPLGWKITISVPYAVLLLLNLRPLRLRLMTRPFLRSYRRLLPSMSATEREALDAGTVWWDGELFTGGPRWEKLMSAKVPALTEAEQAFLDGPCEELCAMLDDWDITHTRADLSPEVWHFIKSRGFFGMIVPKRYGGLEFSAYAHRLLDHCGAEFPGAGGTAAALRNRCAEGSLPAAPRPR
jgi:acyl-CoA dehydrogenase